MASKQPHLTSILFQRDDKTKTNGFLLFDTHNSMHFMVSVVNTYMCKQQLLQKKKKKKKKIEEIEFALLSYSNRLVNI